MLEASVEEADQSFDMADEKPNGGASTAPSGQTDPLDDSSQDEVLTTRLILLSAFHERMQAAFAIQVMAVYRISCNPGDGIVPH